MMKLRKLALCMSSIALAFSLAACGNSSSEPTSESEPSKETPAQEEPEAESAAKPAPAFIVEWEGEAPASVGGADSSAKIGDAAVVQSADGRYILTIDFEYTNLSQDARNFINDMWCDVSPYQNGIELDTPGITSESGVYDYSESFTNIKNGATVSTQLAWVLRDTENPVEIEFGMNEDYEPSFLATLDIESSDK